MEVENRRYMFAPQGLQGLDAEMAPPPPFRMNFLHDVESVWWSFAWVILYHTDAARKQGDNSPGDPHKQLALFHEAFPGKVGTASRTLFFEKTRDLRFNCNGALAQSFDKIHPRLPYFAMDLREKGYQVAQENPPSVVLNDSILEAVHGMAKEHLTAARQLAGDIQLCPLSDLMKRPAVGSPREGQPNKRPRPDKPC